jgi:hypothetical protein
MGSFSESIEGISEEHEAATFGEACPTSAITILESIGPKTTGKEVRLEADGTLSKRAVASIWHAEARTIEAPTAEAMSAILANATELRNRVLVLDKFKNAPDGRPFEIVTEKKLKWLLGKPVGDEGVYDIGGRLIAARLKRGTTPSCWILIDADNPEGIPPEWTALGLGERLKLLEAVLPGLSTCERVEYASSSARVVKRGSDGAPAASHALVRVSHPERIDLLREYMKVATVTKGLSFASPRPSKSEPGKVIRHDQRTLIDCSVWVAGRIVFVSRPDVSKAPGYQVISAGVRIVNPGGGSLDIGAIELPDATALASYKQKTGVMLSFSGDRGRFETTVRGVLKQDTEIEVKGIVKPLVEWFAGLKIGEKLRCETPFRASASEAAFIRKDGENNGILYDSGTTTTYPLVPDFPDDAETLDPPAEEGDAYDETDEKLLAASIPAIEARAFYGPLKEIVEEATRNTEATKIGVALQTITQVATCLRPFGLQLGVTSATLTGLNVFTLQVGVSARGRKGTSAQFADVFIGQAVRALAARLRQDISFEEADRQVKADARRVVHKAACEVERVLTLDVADAAKTAAMVVQLKAEKAEAEARIAAWTKKLAKKILAPATHKKHTDAIRRDEARIVELDAGIANAEAEQAFIEAVIADRDKALVAADETLARAKAMEAAIPEPGPPTIEPWRELFTQLETPPVTLRGVSSGEGIIHYIRDARPPNGTKDDKGDAGVAEKRMLLNLNEFGTVLQQIRRPGSILSTVLRDAYDCEPLMTGSKHSPSRVEEPYVCVSAAAPIAEFVKLTFEDRDATTADNGLANRFLTVYVAREKLVACPLPCKEGERLAHGIAENILKVYRDLKPARPFRATPIELTPEASAVYDEKKGGQLYKEVDRMGGASAKAGKLLDRSTTNLRKLSAILAIMNGESRVSLGALEAAVAWIKYVEASANVIVASTADRRRHAQLQKDAAAVLAAIEALSEGTGSDLVPVRDVRKKLHFEDKRFQPVISFMLSRPPAPIEIVKGEQSVGNGATRARPYLRLLLPPAQSPSPPEEGEADEMI